MNIDLKNVSARFMFEMNESFATKRKFVSHSIAFYCWYWVIQRATVWGMKISING